MTVISVEYSDIVDLLGRRYTIDEIRGKLSMMGAADEGVEGETLSFDVSPNRPDMYSVEGLVRALRGFLGLEVGLPRIEVRESDVKLIVDPSVEAVRPIVSAGIVRNVEMTERLLKSLMDIQEKLHTTIGRRRKKVAIGVHDLDKVTPPFTYRAVPPESISFTPLGLAKNLSLAGILAEHEKGKEYAHILAGKEAYPVIQDAGGVVLSFPPIINGMTTALTQDTRNLFIDVTGLDFAAVNSALNIICASLHERAGRIESVSIERPDRTLKTPDFTPRIRVVDVGDANRLLGLNLTPQEIAYSLDKMRFGAHVSGDTVEVRIPAYRVDVLHEVDLIEDAAVGYGYERVPPRLATQATTGDMSKMTHFSQNLKELMVGYGFQEVMSLSMTDPKIPFKGGASGPLILNPVSMELSSLRSALLPSLLKMMSMNTHRDLPQRIFEVEDVLAGAKNERHMAGAAIHAKASFTEVKSLVQSIIRDVGREFKLEPSDDPNFIPGRCASIIIGEGKVGVFGEIAPEVLDAYGLDKPVAAFEIDASRLI